jgi:crotonobetainyl-CoA:carnitine CoA-transferase CaiB-like acyl-CoA transferase
VSTPEDIAKSPQLEHRHWLQDVRHEETGETLRYPGPPYRLSGTPWSIRRRPPLPGEHNVEVLGELGVQAAELSALQAKGVV